MKLRWIVFVLAIPVAGATVIWYRRGSSQPPGTLRSNVVAGKLDTPYKNILEGAHLQATQGARYDASYVRIAYPNGDVPSTQGACTDVIIRAYRHANIDLQKLIHEDMKKSPREYPRRSNPLDTNIDHRRVPNQIVFFKKFGKTLTMDATTASLKEWRGGDVVYWKLPMGLDHTGIVSDRLGPSGMPMVIHNIAGCTEEDALTEWKIVGHYRYPPDR